MEYRVEPAEKVPFASSSVDLVTVAVAVHWFDLHSFFNEVRRVLKPGGVLAVWTYHLPIVSDEIVDVMQFYYRAVLACCWPEKIKYVDEKYQTLPFPFDEMEPHRIQMKADWDLMQFAGFMSSWSAVRRYLELNGSHPLEAVWTDL